MGALPQDPCCAEVDTCESTPYDYTAHLDKIDTFTIVLGFILIIGTFISVVPQIMKIFRRREVSGVSFHMLIMAAYN